MDYAGIGGCRAEVVSLVWKPERAHEHIFEWNWPRSEALQLLFRDICEKAMLAPKKFQNHQDLALSCGLCLNKLLQI